jgi:hypothetical protein
MKETNIASGIASLQNDLQKNPEIVFNYSQAHTYALQNDTDSNSYFMMKVPKDPTKSTGILPYEVVEREYKAMHENNERIETLHYLKS